ncbi:MAG: tRNA (guanosine(37)-N1)-methyltransferase TrmD [Gammaproteobacteria bacterium]|nr:tRNA (guanosine(37)-N1)-methyltransferase TrmD [Gammaproteobacteria bacterium]
MIKRIDIVTLFPQMFAALTDYGVVGRALQSEQSAVQGQVHFATWNPRDFTKDKHRNVDDRPYGGGPGMVMQVEPLRGAINAAQSAATDKAYCVYLSPQGRVLDNAILLELISQPRLLLVAGRYEGLDERVIEADVDVELSIGDYVLSGGELAAMVLVDAMLRWLPGVLGDDDSAMQDSFAQGLLDYPHYTRPEVLDEVAVPNVLLSGDHEKIRRWRLQQALGRTWLRRPELIRARSLSNEERCLLDEFIREQE